MFYKLKWKWRLYRYRYHCLAEKMYYKRGLLDHALSHALKADKLLLEGLAEIAKLASTIKSRIEA